MGSYMYFVSIKFFLNVIIPANSCMNWRGIMHITRYLKNLSLGGLMSIKAANSLYAFVGNMVGAP